MNEFSTPEDAAYSSIIDLDIIRLPSKSTRLYGPMGFAVMGHREEENLETLIALKRQDYKKLLDYFQQKFPDDCSALESAVQANLSQLEIIKPYEKEFTAAIDSYMASFEQLQNIIAEKYVKAEIVEVEKHGSELLLKEALAKTFLRKKIVRRHNRYIGPEKSIVYADQEVIGKIGELSDLFDKCLSKASPFCEKFKLFWGFDKEVDKIYDARIKEDDFLKYYRNQMTGVPIPRTLNQATNILENTKQLKERYILKTLQV